MIYYSLILQVHVKIIQDKASILIIEIAWILLECYESVPEKNVQKDTFPIIAIKVS